MAQFLCVTVLKTLALIVVLEPLILSLLYNSLGLAVSLSELKTARKRFVSSNVNSQKVTLRLTLKVTLRKTINVNVINLIISFQPKYLLTEGARHL